MEKEGDEGGRKVRERERGKREREESGRSESEE